jgi:thiamine pyrophosphokinase
MPELWHSFDAMDSGAAGGAIVRSARGVTLVGGGEIAPEEFTEALALAPTLVAADGGADAALALGRVPQAVIGDFDSITDAGRRAIPADRQHRIAEQDSTDFEKCLTAIAAPFVLALGFTGQRVDHTLAAFSALARHPARRCLIVSDHDVCFLAPPRLALDLPAGARLSLFPLGPVRGESRGLRWPIDGIAFSPEDRIGTSNEVTGPVHLGFDAPRMLVILPRPHLRVTLRALMPPQA